MYTDSGSAIACSSGSDCIFGSTYGNANSDQYSITASTTDGGRTWVRNTNFPDSLNGGVVSAACDQRYCFIVAENAAVTGQALARTDDNGKRWALVPYPRSWTKGSINADILACSRSLCLVYGGTFPTTPTARYQTGFAATSSNFQTWTRIALPGASQIDQLACIWSGQCWAEYETRGDDLEHLATTLNGGAAWTTLGPISNDKAINKSTALSFALDPEHQVGLACENARTCFILDNSDDLVSTHDGGRTWSLAHGPSRGTTDAITCGPSSTCWMVSVGPPTTAWVGVPPG